MASRSVWPVKASAAVVDGRRTSGVCECGEARLRNHSTCARCEFLDGRGGPVMDKTGAGGMSGKLWDREVIIQLRQHVELSVTQLTELTGCTHREVMTRVTIRLWKQGRLSRRWEEGDVEGSDVLGWNPRIGRSVATAHAHGHWVYRLSG